MTNKLPPLPDEVFDGVKESATITHPKCQHKSTTIRNNTLVCSCGASWMGPDILKLKQLLESR